jgi:hypothetical protein
MTTTTKSTTRITFIYYFLNKLLHVPLQFTTTAILITTTPITTSTNITRPTTIPTYCTPTHTT